MQLLFFLGRTHDLCLAELESVLFRIAFTNLRTVNDSVMIADAPAKFVPSTIMSALGGTMKIAEVLDVADNLNDAEEKVLQHLVQAAGPAKKLWFSVTWPNVPNSPSLHNMKTKLADLDVKARFAEGNSTGLEAALLLHQDIVEIFGMPDEKQFLLAKTVGVQDIDSWSQRDFRKPYRDAHKGMLPPKLARILVNLGVGVRDPHGLRIADPFCGSGTVLMEAALMGAEVVGSDQDPTAVHGAAENLHWLSLINKQTYDIRFSVQDATQLSLQETGEKLDAIVTEPFLGKPGALATEIPNIAMGIEKLYLGSFKRWRQVLKSGARVVVVFPQWVIGERVKNLETLVDRLGSLGYTREKGPLLYTRPQTKVQREVYTFVFESKE